MSADFAMYYIPLNSYQNQAGVHQGKCPRAANPSAAMHHRRAVFWAKRAGLAHLEEEVEEGGRGFRNPKVRPSGVVEVVYLP